MSGVVVEMRVHVGSHVKKGDPIAVLSAMYILFLICLNVGKWKWSFQHRMVERLIKLMLLKGYAQNLVFQF